jgi:Fur family peroxide stress response transcriptional regulator
MPASKNSEQRIEQRIEQRMQRFDEVCRETGVKLTHQRIAIFRELARSEEHPDAEAVFRGVRERMPTVSLDTVYRTLWLLTDLGLINTLGRPRERARFDANLTRHHHFVCVECGLTRDFYSEAFDGLPLSRAAGDIGKVVSTHVEARGLCRDCAAEDEGDSNTPKEKGVRR